MSGHSLTKTQLWLLVMALAAASLGVGCLAPTNLKEQRRTAISVALARKIDEQLGPVDTSVPPGNPMPHLGNNLKGTTDLETVLTYLRLVTDSPLKQMSAGSPPAALTNFQKDRLTSALDQVSVDSNPCTEDKDNDGDADYTDLCLGGANEVRCRILDPHEFRVSFSDCRWPDLDLAYNLLHYNDTSATSYSNSTVVPTSQVSCTTTSSNCYTGTTPSLHQVSIAGTSTAYWDLNGSITYHNGIGGVNEQAIAINYHRLHLQLHDFVQASFQNLLNLNNASMLLTGRRLVYRALDPNGAPALGTTGLPDGMDIFDLDVTVNDNGDDPSQVLGNYRLRLAIDFEDGMVFLHQTDAVLPPRPAFPVTAGAGAGVSYLLTFFDRDHTWNNGVGTGCQVQVENVDQATRTFDIMDPGLLLDPCPNVPAGQGLGF